MAEEAKPAVETPAKSPKGKGKGNFRKTPRDIHGVVYLGHLSDGFYEPQMSKYFKQFGNVKRIKLSRSKRTGRSKGYGFVQFENDEVAKIVADTMSGYSMFKKNMICKHVPSEQVHPDTFIGSGRKFGRPKSHILARERHNKVLTVSKEKAVTKRLKKKLDKRVKKLQELGVNYSLPSQSKETNETVKESSA